MPPTVRLRRVRGASFGREKARANVRRQALSTESGSKEPRMRSSSSALHDEIRSMSVYQVGTGLEIVRD
eukprot:3449984-Pleurochrysis_carterae.AAC.1